MSVFLGVDGGGSKTAYLLVDDTGAVVGHRVGPTVYPGVTTADPDAIQAVLQECLLSLLSGAGMSTSEITMAFLGVPGYGESSTCDDAVDQALGRLLETVPHRYDNDMVCGWAGAFAGSDGVNIVSGTGSIAYARLAGRSVRAGGWGPLFGDEGSAYWIAIEGLRAASQALDGRRPRSLLAEVICDGLHVDGPLALIDLVEHTWRGDRTRVASVAPLVTAAADRDDPDATAIVRTAAHSLAQLALACRRSAVEKSRGPAPVSWSGGVFEAPTVLGAFLDEIRRRPAELTAQPPLLTPAAGAAVYAAQLAGAPLGHDQLLRLRAHRLAAAGSELHENRENRDVSLPMDLWC